MVVAADNRARDRLWGDVGLSGHWSHGVGSGEDHSPGVVANVDVSLRSGNTGGRVEDTSDLLSDLDADDGDLLLRGDKKSLVKTLNTWENAWRVWVKASLLGAGGGTSGEARVGVNSSEWRAALEDVVSEEAHLADWVSGGLGSAEDEVIEVGARHLTSVAWGRFGEWPKRPEHTFLGKGDVAVSGSGGRDVVELNIRSKVDSSLEGGGEAVVKGVGDRELAEVAAARVVVGGSAGVGLALNIVAWWGVVLADWAGETGHLGSLGEEGALRASGEGRGHLGAWPSHVDGHDVGNLGRGKAAKVNHGVLDLDGWGVGGVRTREGVHTGGVAGVWHSATHDGTLFLLLLKATVLAVGEATGAGFTGTFAFVEEAAGLVQGLFCFTESLVVGHVMKLLEIIIIPPEFKIHDTFNFF